MNDTLRALIVDDELPACDLIAACLRDFPRIRLAGICHDGVEGARMVLKLKPDLVFLDIQMPRATGLEMLELIDPASMPAVIFTTAYDEYALKAFELNAVDYLLKPIGKDRFRMAVEKAVSAIRNGERHTEGLRRIVEGGGGSTGFAKRFLVREGEAIRVIPPEELFCAEARDDYVLLCTEKEQFLKKKTLKSLQAQLDPALFIRVHRSCIVRLDAIQRIEPYSRDAYLLRLVNGHKVPVSKQGYTALRGLLRF